MSKPVLLFLAMFAALAGSITPVHAKSRIIAKITSPKNHPGVLLSRGLLPTQHYRIVVVVPRKVKYTGLASEQFTFVLNKRLGTYHTTLNLKGAGTRSFTLAIPRILHKAHVESWLLVAEAGSSVKHTTIQLRLVQG